MLLKSPFVIGSRLLPALRVGGGELSLQCVGCVGNKLTYRWYADLPAGEFSDCDLGVPPGASDAETDQAAFGALLAFLSAAAEGLAYQESTGRESENAGLFPRPVAEWARAEAHELDALREEIESGECLLSDE